MDDLKSVTLSHLRDLARKHLGPGHSKLTKKELIAELAEFVPALKKLARLAGIELPTRARPAAKTAASSTKPAREPRGEEARVAEKKEPEPKKKAAERKKEPEPKKEPEKRAAEKKVAERKKEPEPKKEPEKKAAEKKVAERRKEPEPKKEPEKKAAERKKEPEPRKPVEKKEPEPKREPEKKAAAQQGRKPSAPRQAAPKAEDFSQSMRPAHVVNFPPRPRHARSAEEEWAESSEVVDSPELESVFQHAAEPLMEGFFVARLMGERELRRHHLTEEQAPRAITNGSADFEEQLGELPLDYGNDLAMALARDPHTLFITWDFSSATLARAREGLDSPRAILRVFDGDRLVREVEFVPESRSFYIHGLPPGRPYRVEGHFVGLGGHSRRIGHSTRPLVLPQTGPSQDTSVRFMQMPPPRAPVQAPGTTAALGPAPAEGAPSSSPATTVEEREYITWRRVALPGSDEMASVAESRRERIERQAREGAGPPGHREYLEVTARPPGSSEQSAVGGPSRGGASEQTHWTPPPSGRGR